MEKDAAFYTTIFGVGIINHFFMDWVMAASRKRTTSPKISSSSLSFSGGTSGGEGGERFTMW